MKIYWKYGKEIDVLLYIDRIIFIKIHIHVQELPWSRVLCQSLLAGEGERRSWCQRHLVSPLTWDGVRPCRSRAACPQAAVGQDSRVVSAVMPHSSGGISPGTKHLVKGAGVCPTRVSGLQDGYFPPRGKQTPAGVCPWHYVGQGRLLARALLPHVQLLERNKQLSLSLSGRPYPASIMGTYGAVHDAAAADTYIYFCCKIFLA